MKLPGTEYRLMRCFGFICLFFLICFCAYLFPQNKNAKKEVPAQNRSAFKVKVNSVVIKAAVTDKSGDPVTDLTTNDFKLYEDGKPQIIQTFALESPDPPELEQAQVASASHLSKREAPKTGKREAPKQDAERTPRLISIVIDDLTMQSGGPGSILDFPRVVAAVKKFVTTDLSSADQVAILSGSRNVQFPFTDDKKRLLEELDAVPRKLNPLPPLQECCFDYDAWMFANDWIPPQFAVKYRADGTPTFKNPSGMEQQRMHAIRQTADVQSRTRNLLYTIRLHLRVLSHFEGPKMVVLFSDGFLTEIGERTGAAEAHELQELIDIALRSGIVLNAVSTRSIPVTLDDRTVVMPQGATMAYESDTVMQEKPMAQMASETGGEFFPRSNNAYVGLPTIAHRRHSYYVLTYTMPPHKPDGTYHHIKLEVTRPDLKVSYRKGYLGPTEELTFENTNREDLMAALHGLGNMNEIPITFSYSSSQEDDSTYSVSFVTDVDVRKLRFAKEDNQAQKSDQPGSGGF